METDISERKVVVIGWRGRLLLGAIGGLLLGILVLTAMLRPDAHGCGTHQQLGFPPCAFLLLFHRPCPTCGMTTAWTCLGKGAVIAAVRANLTGSLLWLLAVFATVWLLGSAARGKWFVASPNRDAAAWISASILAVMLVEWVVRLSLW